jgi:simple sugar transport system permease protein
MTIFRRSEFIIAAILVVAMVLIGLINPAFWSLDNMFGLLRSNVIIGIMALGVLVVMISGGIDVSFTAFAVAAMYLTVKGMLYFGYEGVLVPFVAATLIGLVLGAFNAFFIHTFRMIPLIVTLGTGSVVRGLLLGLVGTSIINIDAPGADQFCQGQSRQFNVSNRNEFRSDSHDPYLSRPCARDASFPALHDDRA